MSQIFLSPNPDVALVYYHSYIVFYCRVVNQFKYWLWRWNILSKHK